MHPTLASAPAPRQRFLPSIAIAREGLSRRESATANWDHRCGEGAQDWRFDPKFASLR
jgi:hypothetical protein